jgi:hypothetical protein
MTMHTRTTSRAHRSVASWLALVASLAAGPLAAQLTDYGFRAPVGYLTLRGGAQAPTANSDLFAFTNDILTLGRRNFAGASWGGDLGGTINDHFSWELSADVAMRTANSEYRAWQESNGAAIRQRTDFRRIPLTLGLRWNLVPMGERIGRFAWIPKRIVPFVAAGGGATWYRFRQAGDFVDFANGNAINTDVLESDGWAPTAVAAIGLDVALSPYLAWTTALRATYARAAMSPDFRGFAPLDVGGGSLTTGVQLRFP